MKRFERYKTFFLYTLFFLGYLGSAHAIVFNPITSLSYAKNGSSTYVVNSGLTAATIITPVVGGGTSGYNVFFNTDGQLAVYGIGFNTRTGAITVDPTKIKQQDFTKVFTITARSPKPAARLATATVTIQYYKIGGLTITWDSRFAKSNGILSIYLPKAGDADYATLYPTATLTLKNNSSHRMTLDGIQLNAPVTADFNSFQTAQIQSDIAKCKTILDGSAQSAGASCTIRFTFQNTTAHPSQNTIADHVLQLTGIAVTDKLVGVSTKYSTLTVKGRDELLQCPAITDIQNKWDLYKDNWAIIDPISGALTARNDSVLTYILTENPQFYGRAVLQNYTATVSTTEPNFNKNYANVVMCRYVPFKVQNNHVIHLLNLRGGLFKPPFEYDPKARFGSRDARFGVAYETNEWYSAHRNYYLEMSQNVYDRMIWDSSALYAFYADLFSPPELPWSVFYNFYGDYRQPFE